MAQRRRKRYQQGSVVRRQHGAHEVWVLKWRDGRGRHHSKVLGRTSQMSEGEAQAASATILAPLNASRQAAGEWKLGPYIRKVFLPLKCRYWKSSTAGANEQRIEQHIIKELGQRPLAEITRAELQAFLDSKAKKYTKSTVLHLRWDFADIFRLAKADRLIGESPAEALAVAERMCKESRQLRSLTETQAAELLAALAVRERLVCRLGIFEGLRSGEIFALQWWDQNGRALQIRRRVYRGQVEETTKSGKPRTVALSAGTVALLAQWRLESEPATDKAWLFPSAIGKLPLQPGNLWRRYIQPLLKDLRLEWLSFHQLRHTNGTLMKAAGADVKISADQRGHGVGVSLDVYTHSPIEDKIAAVDALEKLIETKAGLVKVTKRTGS